MKLTYLPKTELEIFGMEVYEKLAKVFPQTYFVGGLVRNLLLKKPITDIDITTVATPKEVQKLFITTGYRLNTTNSSLGIVIASTAGLSVEIATFRKEIYMVNDRFPKISFIKAAELDCKRRDFTINSLYYQPQINQLFDYSGSGLVDLNNRELHFAGNANTKIKEDPLRIVRALRFSHDYKFSIDTTLQKQITKHSLLLNNISKKRIDTEILKSKFKSTKTFLKSYTQKYLT